MSELGWWVLRGSMLRELLQRAHAGEDPDLIYTELYANSDTEHIEGTETP